MAKDNKLQTAIDKSRGETAIATTDGEMTLDAAAQATLGAFIGQASAQELAAEIASGDIEAAPILFEIKEGMRLVCEVCDRGETEIEDVNTRKPKMVTTWILRLLNPNTYEHGPKVSVLGTAQLDRQLPPFMGCTVIVVRGATIKTKKNRQLTEYFVGLDKRAPGQRDGTVATAKPSRMIDTTAS